MILVDTSVWIDFFRGIGTPQVEVLVANIYAGRIGIPDLVLTEVLQGCDTNAEFDEVHRTIVAHPIVEVVDGHAALQAARNYRLLRAKGITMRKTIDTLIATRCILDRMPLLYSDRDFDPFVEHLGLVSALDIAPGMD